MPFTKVSEKYGNYYSGEGKFFLINTESIVYDVFPSYPFSVYTSKCISQFPSCSQLFSRSKWKIKLKRVMFQNPPPIIGYDETIPPPVDLEERIPPPRGGHSEQYVKGPVSEFPLKMHRRTKKWKTGFNYRHGKSWRLNGVQDRNLIFWHPIANMTREHPFSYVHTWGRVGQKLTQYYGFISNRDVILHMGGGKKGRHFADVLNGWPPITNCRN